MITFRETSIINLFSYGIRWNVIGRIVRYRRINGSTVASCWFIWPQLNRFPALGNGIVGVEFPQLRPPRHLLVETTANWSGWNVTLDGSRGRQLPFSPFLHFLLPVKSKKKKGRSRMEISKWKIKETETETERKRWKKKRRRFPRLGFVDGRWFPDESRTLRASTASLWQPSSPDGWAGFLSATEIDPENLTKSST